MNIKWNWGTGLVVGIVLFMSFILIMVYNMVQVDFDLVEDDYYPQAIVYQNKIEKRQAAEALSKPVLIQQTKDSVRVAFQDFFNPMELKANIWFYRPSLEDKDIQLTVEPSNSRIVRLPKSNFIPGHYTVKIDYQHLGVSYYQETKVYIK